MVEIHGSQLYWGAYALHPRAFLESVLTFQHAPSMVSSQYALHLCGIYSSVDRVCTCIKVCTYSKCMSSPKCAMYMWKCEIYSKMCHHALKRGNGQHVVYSPQPGMNKWNHVS